MFFFWCFCVVFFVFLFLFSVFCFCFFLDVWFRADPKYLNKTSDGKVWNWVDKWNGFVAGVPAGSVPTSVVNMTLPGNRVTPYVCLFCCCFVFFERWLDFFVLCRRALAGSNRLFAKFYSLHNRYYSLFENDSRSGFIVFQYGHSSLTLCLHARI